MEGSTTDCYPLAADHSPGAARNRHRHRWIPFLEIVIWKKIYYFNFYGASFWPGTQCTHFWGQDTSFWHASPGNLAAVLAPFLLWYARMLIWRGSCRRQIWTILASNHYYQLCPCISGWSEFPESQDPTAFALVRKETCKSPCRSTDTAPWFLQTWKKKLSSIFRDVYTGSWF